MQKILLISGWGLGCQPLAGLKTALENLHFQVELIDIFDSSNPAVLEGVLQKAVKADILMGWSLGGQLATILAQKIFEQTGQAKILVTLASNPCFVATVEWPNAMSRVTFEAFKGAFLNDREATLKRFCHLVGAGGVTARNDIRYLQSFIKTDDPINLISGLQQLEQLNLVSILQKYPGRQYHLVSEQDQLIPCQIITDFHFLKANLLITELLPNVGHGFPYSEIILTSKKICSFLNMT